MTKITNFIINFITVNCDECQFSLKFLIDKYRKENNELDIPRLERIEERLKSHFGNEIIIHSTKTDKFICFQRTLGKVIKDQWYAERDRNEKNERKRIIDLAANFILHDIRAMKFVTENYVTINLFK